jgi:hypothetical protein
MNNLKKKLRFVLLILLIIIATFGIGLTGVAPLSAFKRKTKSGDVFNIEQLDDRDKKESIKESIKP